MKLVVLRMGHRPVRDKRITTHVALVARAFGADGIIISDVSDSSIKEKIIDVRDRFGGDFFIEMGQNWLKVLNNWKNSDGEIIHLTMYGIPLPEIIEKIRVSPKDKLIIIGGAKIPSDVYKIANYNVSITNQPHSEVAALAVFLDQFFQGAEFQKRFTDAKFEIIPAEKGKIVKKANLGDL